MRARASATAKVGSATLRVRSATQGKKNVCLDILEYEDKECCCVRARDAIRRFPCDARVQCQSEKERKMGKSESGA